MKYFFSKKLNTQSFEKAIEQVTKELKKGGFGILNEIDLQATLRKKLDVDFKPYKILSACNPQLAYQALQAEDKIGILLPCNVIVEKHENGEIEVAAVDPMASMQAVENEALQDIAVEVQQKLKQVIQNLN
jgi:uncharacterized protein (DUF302 family)